MLNKIVYFLLVFPLMAASASAAPITEQYIRVPYKKSVDMATLKVTKINDKQIQIFLEVMLHTPDQGFVRVPRWGVLENEKLEKVGNIAVYREPSGSIEPCVIVFVFDPKGADVAQFGECASFGHEVFATGRYAFKASSGSQD